MAPPKPGPFRYVRDFFCVFDDNGFALFKNSQAICELRLQLSCPNTWLPLPLLPRSETVWTILHARWWTFSLLVLSLAAVFTRTILWFAVMGPGPRNHTSNAA